jgi:hypothetical protein
LDALTYARSYDPAAPGVDNDLRYRLGPIEPVLGRLDPLLREAPQLSGDEFENLVAFLANGLLDRHAQKEHVCKLIPAAVPSGLRLMKFESCVATK